VVVLRYTIYRRTRKKPTAQTADRRPERRPASSDIQPGDRIQRRSQFVRVPALEGPSERPLWWPPTTIAGHELGLHLDAVPRYAERPPADVTELRSPVSAA
jgi:hypothetical protein